MLFSKKSHYETSTGSAEFLPSSSLICRLFSNCWPSSLNQWLLYCVVLDSQHLQTPFPAVVHLTVYWIHLLLSCLAAGTMIGFLNGPLCSPHFSAVLHRHCRDVCWVTVIPSFLWSYVPASNSTLPLAGALHPKWRCHCWIVQCSTVCGPLGGKYQQVTHLGTGQPCKPSLQKNEKEPPPSKQAAPALFWIMV